MCTPSFQTDFFDSLIDLAKANNKIANEYYDKYNVKRGLRNTNGTGVLVGLTEVGNVHGYNSVNGQKIPDEGRLSYRGINLNQLVEGFQSDGRRGFEEAVFLLLFARLPSKTELEKFNALLDENRYLPDGFTENMILKVPSQDVMNKLQRCVLVLYSNDPRPDDTTISNVLRQSVELIARFPTVVSYGFQAKNHYFNNSSLYLHPPQRGIGTAENILYMTRKDSQYTKTEAETLDLLLVIHAEHGGGNNSAFATHVVSSSGTDTYSAVVAAIGSLKGPKHGGANKMVLKMADDIRANVSDWSNESLLKEYLIKIIKKQAFDKSGLIYGMGHAIYTLSDPRANLLREKARELAVEKDRLEEFELYKNIETLSKEVFKELKGDNFTICANVDLYSGFVYQMLGIPDDLYTPLFAVARIAGWSSHRIEQIASDQRIMRPAYRSIKEYQAYTRLSER